MSAMARHRVVVLSEAGVRVVFETGDSGLAEAWARMCQDAGPAEVAVVHRRREPRLSDPAEERRARG